MSISKENIYKLEGRVPLKTAIPLGMQHVLAMYAGNLAPILVITGVLNVPADIKVSLLQSALYSCALFGKSVRGFPPLWEPARALSPSLSGSDYSMPRWVTGQTGMPLFSAHLSSAV